MSAFDNWCLLRGVSSLPATPADVAQFVKDCEPLGIEKVWELVQEISGPHHAGGFADPTAGGPVSAAINTISKLVPPRSWSKEEKLRFYSLPYDLQLTVIRRTAQTEKEMRRAQNEAAEARRQLASIQQPKVKDGISETVAA